MKEKKEREGDKTTVAQGSSTPRKKKNTNKNEREGEKKGGKERQEKEEIGTKEKPNLENKFQK